MWPQMVGLSGMPKESFLFFFFSPFSFPESSPEASLFSFLLALPSEDPNLFRFVEGFSAKNFRERCKPKI